MALWRDGKWDPPSSLLLVSFSLSVSPSTDSSASLCYSLAFWLSVFIPSGPFDLRRLPPACLSLPLLCAGLPLPRVLHRGGHSWVRVVRVVVGGRVLCVFLAASGSPSRGRPAAFCFFLLLRHVVCLLLLLSRRPPPARWVPFVLFIREIGAWCVANVLEFCAQWK